MFEILVMFACDHRCLEHSRGKHVTHGRRMKIPQKKYNNLNIQNNKDYCRVIVNIIVCHLGDYTTKKYIFSILYLRIIGYNMLYSFKHVLLSEGFSSPLCQCLYSFRCKNQRTTFVCIHKCETDNIKCTGLHLENNIKNK